LDRNEKELEIEKLPKAATSSSKDFRGESWHTEESLGCGSTTTVTELRWIRDGVVTGTESAVVSFSSGMIAVL